MHKIFLHFFGDKFTQDSGIFKYQLEASIPQVLFVYFTQVIERPKLEIDLIKCIDESLDIRYSYSCQLIDFKQLCQRFLNIGIIIPQRVVQVKEDVSVLFQMGDTICGKGYSQSY